MTKPIRILLDMDGVIADFATEYKNINGLTPKEGYANKRKKDKLWDRFVVSDGFKNIKMLPDGQELIDFLFQSFLDKKIGGIEICSSAGGEKHYYTVRHAKIDWLSRHGLGDLKANITVNGKDKANVINDHWRDILIDDTDHIVDNFKEHGGEAILHTSTKDTIEQLNKIFEGNQNGNN